MKVLHSSDIHGNYKWLLKKHKDTDFDVWLDTGDFFPNVGRVQKTGYTIDRGAEYSYQGRWWGWKQLASRFTEWLDGRPVVTCPGNHDFINLAIRLEQVSCPNVHDITTKGVTVLGRKWAGFRHIPLMVNEWEGETSNFSGLVEKTFKGRPDILVTHAPPEGILNAQGPVYGIPALTSALFGPDSTVKHHFFGHDHYGGGMDVEEGGIHFYNGACEVRLHTIED